MQENNIIKSLTMHTCPHCNGEIVIESQMTPPSIGSLYTPKDVEDAKMDCQKRVEVLSISDEKKAGVKKWLENPDTVFGPGEVENIIASLLKSEE